MGRQYEDSESSSEEEAEVTSQSSFIRAERDADMRVPLSEAVEEHGYHMPAGHGHSDDITQDDVNEVREKLQKNLQEEQMLVGLQMQLLTQLEQLNESISKAESEERLAKLALQQGQVTRALKKCQNPDANVEEETITVRLN